LPRTGGAPERAEGSVEGPSFDVKSPCVDRREPQTVFETPVSNTAGPVILRIVLPGEDLCVRERCSCPFFRSRLRSHRRLRVVSESFRGTAAIAIHGRRDSTIAPMMQRPRNGRARTPLEQGPMFATRRGGRAPTREPTPRPLEQRGSETCHAPGSARMRCGSASGNAPRTESTRVANAIIGVGSAVIQTREGPELRTSASVASYRGHPDASAASGGSLSLAAVHRPWHESDPSLRSG
jgi:hypothetical protein